MSQQGGQTTAIDPEIFKAVQLQIEQDTAVRDAIKESLKQFERQIKQINSILSRVHSVPPSEVLDLVERAAPFFADATKDLHELIKIVEPYPYYKYNNSWTHELRHLITAMLLAEWLKRSYGAPATPEGQGHGLSSLLLTLEELGVVLNVPVNLKTEDKFHLTIEEYLHSVVSLVEELARLTTNAVIQRDFVRPGLISRFVKDVFSSFQVLNLKNDSLRRRSDGLKYQVKKIEDINYDLIVRNLVPAPKAATALANLELKEEPMQE